MVPPYCDLLVLESTYGDRNHGDRTHRLERLGEVLTRSLADGGLVYIPAFSLGRSQELLYELDRLFSDSDLCRRFPGLTATPPPVFLILFIGYQAAGTPGREILKWGHL